MPIAALIPLISALVPVVNNIIDWIAKARETAKQSKELTPEEEAALDAEIAKLKVNPEIWQEVQPL